MLLLLSSPYETFYWRAYCFWKQPYLVVTTKKHLDWDNMSWVDLNLPLWDDTVNFLPTVFEVCLQWTVAFRATHHCNGVGSWKWNHQNSKGISEISYSAMFLLLFFFTTLIILHSWQILLLLLLLLCFFVFTIQCGDGWQACEGWMTHKKTLLYLESVWWMM